VALNGERGRGEMRLLYGMGADEGGETSCLAADTGVLARCGWGAYCTPVLEYAESRLFGLNTPLADLRAE
jgi:hypothetical protein